MATALREIGQGLIDPKYCCVGASSSLSCHCSSDVLVHRKEAEQTAVPLVNFGIYGIIGEQFIVSLAAGLLSFTTPKCELRPSLTRSSYPTALPMCAQQS